MTVGTQTRRRIGAGGVVFMVIALLVTAITAYVLFVPIDATNFESTTGLNWEEFSSFNPEAADYLTREARLLAIGFLGLSALAAAVAWETLRRDGYPPSRALWLWPSALLGAGIVFLTGDGADLGVAYLVAGTAAASSLGHAYRSRRTTRAQ